MSYDPSECICGEDTEGVQRMIPVANITKGNFRLFGMDLAAIREARKHLLMCGVNPPITTERIAAVMDKLHP